MSLLVNADDLGKSEEINRAIAEAFEKGLINHTTLMANMPFAEEAVKLAKSKGFADRIGLHLNITEGFPLSSSIKNNPLVCSPEGGFSAAFYHSLRYRLYMDELTIDQIGEEFRAQIARFHALGLKELHIDSHHHVHTNYPVYLALKRLGREYEFSYIRLSRNLYRGGNPFNRVYKNFYNSSIKKICKESADLFCSARDLEDFTGGDGGGLRELVSKKRLEIMVHPMYKNGVLFDTDRSMEEGIYPNLLTGYSG